ncbi:MAG: alkaline phosphatase [Litorimonas sp.]
MPILFNHIHKNGLYAVLIALCLTACIAQTDEKRNYAAESIRIEASQSQNKTAKNLIIFIGDGMSLSTVTAARIFDGQSKGMSGEENRLAFEDFENLALVKTYNTNAQVPDSAGTATAILSGYRTNIGTINVRPNTDVKKMVLNSCVTKRTSPTLLNRARKSGLSVGVISTARITHATPAAMYGHSVSRNWETEADIDPRAAKFGCKSLAQQFLKNTPDITLSGGKEKFTQQQLSDWQKKDSHIYVTDAAGFRTAPKDKTLLGLFTPSHMSYESDRDNTKEPSLAEMTAFTIDALATRNTGYVIMIEAGRIDHAHHGTNAYRAMRDMQALNEAVQVAKDKAGDDTLIMVTADHSHVFTIGGYPARGNPILGLVRNPDPEAGEPAKEYAKDLDGKPYTTLSYANGPNPRQTDSPVLTDNAVQSKDYLQQTTVRLESETHSGEDVPLYATGPGAQFVRGVIDQNEISHIIDEVLSLK